MACWLVIMALFKPKIVVLNFVFDTKFDCFQICYKGNSWSTGMSYYLNSLPGFDSWLFGLVNGMSLWSYSNLNWSNSNTKQHILFFSLFSATLELELMNRLGGVWNAQLRFNCGWRWQIKMHRSKTFLNGSSFKKQELPEKLVLSKGPQQSS